VTTDPAPRIPQITEAERTDDVRAMFAAMANVSTQNNDHNFVLKTLAQHPTLTQPFLAFNQHLLTTSKLPVRLRQIAILRVAWTKRCRYMWASHLRMSLRLGLGADDFAAVQSPASPHWKNDERVILRSVDQMLERTDLDEANWKALGAILDRQAIMDLLFTVGAYVLLAIAFNAMRIQREPELIELAQRYGSPG
jgi:4-carboxymuconolactone decarboxylase